jgi:hypothetical protein
MPAKLTPEIIAAAILGFEAQKRHVDSHDCRTPSHSVRRRRGTNGYAGTRGSNPTGRTT